MLGAYCSPGSTASRPRRRAMVESWRLSTDANPARFHRPRRPPGEAPPRPGGPRGHPVQPIGRGRGHGADPIGPAVAAGGRATGPAGPHPGPARREAGRVPETRLMNLVNVIAGGDDLWWSPVGEHHKTTGLVHVHDHFLRAAEELLKARGTLKARMARLDLDRRRRPGGGGPGRRSTRPSASTPWSRRLAPTMATPAADKAGGPGAGVRGGAGPSGSRPDRPRDDRGGRDEGASRGDRGPHLLGLAAEQKRQQAASAARIVGDAADGPAGGRAGVGVGRGDARPRAGGGIERHPGRRCRAGGRRRRAGSSPGPDLAGRRQPPFVDRPSPEYPEEHNAMCE